MAAARESISPLLNNVRSRRLSLELCQKIGSHLLSPNRNSSGGSDSPMSLSPAPSTPKLLTGSPFARQTRRGSSGCIGLTSSPLISASFNAFAAAGSDGAPAHNRRRSSLTPIYSNTCTSTLSSSFASSINDIAQASFTVPTISIDSSEDGACQSNNPQSQPQCQWNVRRKLFNAEDDNDDGGGNGGAESTEWRSHATTKLNQVFLTPNSCNRDTKQLQQSLSSCISSKRNGGEQDNFLNSSNASNSFCNVIVHETTARVEKETDTESNHNANANHYPVVERKVDPADGWVGNCDLNNNNFCNYNTNNENIGPEHLQLPNSSFFSLYQHHRQQQQRRKSFPTLTIAATRHHNQSSPFKSCNNNGNQFDGSLAALVAQQCGSSLALNPHEILGKGSFGTVIGAIYRGQPAAVKVIHTTARNVISLNGERNAARLAPHPNIARIYEIFQLGAQNQALIVMERLRAGSLLTALNDSSIYLNGQACIQLSAEIASALFYCHLNGILHLDVKPSNILIDFQNHCKLSDFGNSKTLQDLMSSANFAKLDGTVAYIAPECFRGTIPTDKCDVYSFGITMWQILSRESPYQGEAEHSIIYKVVAQAMRPTLIHHFHIGKFNSQEIFPKFVHIYEMCWQQNPEARPTMKAVNDGLLSLQS